MHYILDQLFARRKLLAKKSLLLSFIMLFCVSSLFISQFTPPSILRKYFYRFGIGGDMIVSLEYDEGLDRLGEDFEIIGHSESFALVSAFPDIVESSSIEIYGCYSPLFVGGLSILDTIINSTTNYERKMIVVDSTLFSDLRSSSNQTSSTGGIQLVTENQSIAFGEYNFTGSAGRSFNGTTIIDNFIDIDTLNLEFPILSDYLTSLQNFNLSKVIFQEVAGFSAQILFESSSWSIVIPLNFVVKFAPQQQDIVYWSIDSTKKYTQLQSKIISSLSESDDSLSKNLFICNKLFILQQNAPFINLVHSFIRSIQLIIWLVAIYLIVQLFKKSLNLEKDQELRALFAGTNWFSRTTKIVVESMSIIIVGAIPSIILSIPFVWVQTRLFPITFFWTREIIVGIGSVVGIIFLLVTAIKIDFEFHLRRLLKGLNTESYKPFTAIPQIGKLLAGLSLLLPIWFLNKTFISLGYILGYVIIASLLGVIAAYSIRFLVTTTSRAIQKYKKRNNKQQSKTFLTFRLWKKNLFTKILVFSVLVALVSSFVTFSVTIVGMGYQNHLFLEGGEITFSTDSNVMPSTVSQFLDNSSLISRYITDKQTYHTGTNFALFKNENLTQSDNCQFIAVDFDTYLSFFDKSDKKLWLQSGELTSANSSVYISEKFSLLGYSIGDTITLADSTNITIKGIYQYWPGAVKSDWWYSIILSDAVFNPLLAYKNSSSNFSYYYRLRVNPDKIFPALDYLEPHLKEIDYSNLNALDVTAITGFNVVFLNPVIILGEIITLASILLVLLSTLSGQQTNPLAKSYSLLMMTGNANRPYWLYKLFEIGLFALLFISINGLMLMGMAIFNFIAGNPIGLAFRSDFLTLPALAMLGVFVVILILQALAEWLVLRKTDLAMQFRHPE
jgi:hypothetical protein